MKAAKGEFDCNEKKVKRAVAVPNCMLKVLRGE